MLIQIVLFIAGLILLVKGSDFFVKSSATIAKRLGISEFVIGLTLVAFGTSLPELISSIFAALKHESGIILGNVVGSNLANIGLIIGIGALLMGKIKTKKQILNRDGYIMIFVSLLFFVFIFDGTLSRLEAGFFLLLYFVYLMYVLLVKIPAGEKEPFMSFIKYFFKLQYLITIRSQVMVQLRRIKEGVKNGHTKKKVTPGEAKKIGELFKASIIKDILVILISGTAIYFGAKYVIEEAVYFATILNIPSTLIGITMIAVGTSLPELSVTISAVRKKYGGMVIGNILGSNIANILLVLGVSGMMFPLTALKQTIYYAIPLMLAISFLLIFLMQSGYKLTRKEGVLLLGFYVLSIIFMIFKFM